MVKHFHLKLILLITPIFIIFAVAVYLVTETVIIESFKDVERDDYEKSMEVLNNALNADAEYLSGQTTDWAVWDDSYSFVLGENETYIEDNVADNMLENLSIDYFAVFDKNYKLRYLRSYDGEGKETEEKNQPLEDKLINAAKEFEEVKAEFDISKELYFPWENNAGLTSVSYILHSDNSGPPAGYMMMGEFLNDVKIKDLSESNNLKLSISNWDGFAEANKDNPDLVKIVKDNQVGYDYVSDEEANGYLELEDTKKNSIGVIKNAFERVIYQKALSSRNYYLALTYVTTLVALIVSIFIYNQLNKARKKQFEGETKYQLLFNQNVMPLLLIKLDKGWHWKEIIEANKAAKTLYGLDNNVTYAKKPINLLYGMDERAVGDLLTNIANIGIAVDQTDLVIGENRLTVEIIARAFDIAQEKYLLISIKDLSERVQYERKLEEYARNLKKFQLSVENSSDQIIITDPDGIIIYANKSLHTITGFTPEDAMGKKAGTSGLWGGLMDQEFYRQMWETIKTQKVTFEGEFKNKKKDGTEYDAAASITPILDERGTVLFFVAVERDITKAKEIDRAKTEFVSLASHQLRTPLSAINWYTEMLLEEDSGKINDTQREYLNEIYRGNKRMVDLVNSLLNVSRIDMGTFDINTEPTNIVDMAKEVVKELTPAMKGKNLQLKEEYDTIPMVMLDQKLTRIILQNLISNAFKYTPSKGVVEISVKRYDEKCITIMVKDTGYGIPKSQQDKMFTKLFRADNVQSLDTEGTGLGLYIVKSIIDNAGGKISFESEENKGSTFTVQLPFAGMKEKTGTKTLDV